MVLFVRYSFLVLFLFGLVLTLLVSVWSSLVVEGDLVATAVVVCGPFSSLHGHLACHYHNRFKVFLSLPSRVKLEFVLSEFGFKSDSGRV